MPTVIWPVYVQPTLDTMISLLAHLCQNAFFASVSSSIPFTNTPPIIGSSMHGNPRFKSLALSASLDFGKPEGLQNTSHGCKPQDMVYFEKTSNLSMLYYPSLWGLDILCQKLLSNPEEINIQGGLFGNPLQAAVANQHKRVVELLLANGADVNAKGGKYGNALVASSACGNLNLLETLLDQGANLGAPGLGYRSALQTAAIKGDIQIVETLIKRGADVNEESGLFGFALAAAAFKGHDRIVELLIQKGADVNACGGIRGTALHQAVNDESTAIRILLNSGADPNAVWKCWTPLLVACSLGNERGVEELLQGGANPLPLAGSVTSPREMAIEGGWNQIVEMLDAYIRMKEVSLKHFPNMIQGHKLVTVPRITKNCGKSFSGDTGGRLETDQVRRITIRCELYLR